MSNVAFLGTGLLGRGRIERRWRQGDAVAVWNRTASKARALETRGATVSPNAAQAVANADRVHMALSEDAVVDQVLAEITPHLRSGAMVIDHSTTSPAGTSARHRKMAN